MREKINYYKHYTDDFVRSKNQDYKLPHNYKWIHKNRIYGVLSAFIFRVSSLLGRLYCYIFFHTEVVSSEPLPDSNEGFFIYGNHTQAVADVFNPAIVCRSKRFFTIASASNLGIPVLGRLLPIMGALPIPDSIHNFREFLDAIHTRIEEGYCIVIYPEAHVWPYCTFIRDFPETSFRYPAELEAPCYVLTTTYHKRRWFKRPRIIIYIDGPFYPDESLPLHARRRELRDKVYSTMVERSRNNTYEYIRYISIEGGDT